MTERSDSIIRHLSFVIFWFRFFISGLNQGPRHLVVPVHRRGDLQNTVQPSLPFQSLVYKIPGAGLFGIDFTAALIRSATGAVVKAFGTHGDRTDTPGEPKYADSA